MISQLHLPSLTVKGFRGVRSLELQNLGQVTLLAGKNGIGKTAILEAIRVYASRGDIRLLTDLIVGCDEMMPGSDEAGDKILIPDFTSLFYEYDPNNEDKGHPSIQISAEGKPEELTLQLVDDFEPRNLFSDNIDLKAFKITIGSSNRTIPLGLMYYHDRVGFRSHRLMSRNGSNTEAWLDPIKLESLGPGLIQTIDVARLWDSVALTKAEDFVTEALRLVVGDGLERLAVIGDPSVPYARKGRRVVAKLKSSTTPIPLKRLGDGVQRFLGIALALANCQNGILLIDEVENGIHHSIQESLWRMIFRVAVESNIQVVAATHSWDCIANFAVAADETPAIGTLYRLEHFGDDLHAVHYSEENLKVAEQQRIEVR